jgi:hypothetical protein
VRLHLWHSDPTWQIIGCHRYEQCRCGARRTSRAYSNLMGPVAADWPDQCDSHGQYRDSSGWQHGDWQTPGYPSDSSRIRGGR